MTYNVSSGTLNPTIPYHTFATHSLPDVAFSHPFVAGTMHAGHMRYLYYSESDFKFFSRPNGRHVASIEVKFGVGLT